MCTQCTVTDVLRSKLWLGALGAAVDSTCTVICDHTDQSCHIHLHQTDSICTLPMHMHQNRLTIAEPSLTQVASLANSAAEASTATALGSRCCKPNAQAAAKASFLSLGANLVWPRFSYMFWLAAELEDPQHRIRKVEQERANNSRVACKQVTSANQLSRI